MRQVLADTDGIKVLQTQRPTPKEGEVLVRSTLVGICGSDTHALVGMHSFLKPPYVPGHEAVGTVAELGPGVEGIEVGSRVLIKPNLDCGTCENCRAGRDNACDTLNWIGCDPKGEHPGAMADYVLAPAKNLYELPGWVSDEEGVLVECLATPVHAVRIAGDVEGSRVLVIGVGTIGLLTVLAARRAGAGSIAVIDLEQSKLDRALAQGADAAILAASAGVEEQVRKALGGPADVVFDCVANEATVRQSFELVRKAGSVIVVGVPAGPFTVEVGLLQDRELRLQGSAAYAAKDVETALLIASESGIPAKGIVTAIYEMEDAPKAFAEASQNVSGKVMVRC